MRFILACLLMIGWNLGLAQISGAEYFIDTDPGFGKGMTMTLSPGADIDLDFNVPLSAVSKGFHSLYLRVYDAQGHWSQTHEHVFFNTELPPPDQSLKAVEYFIDADPGDGNGTAVAIPANQKDLSIPFHVDLGNVSVGAHILFVRAMDKTNSWSTVTQHAFYVRPGGNLSNIVALKYNFERPGFTSPVLTYDEFTPGPSVSLNFNADLSQLPGDAEYTMNIWAVSSDGMQSLVQTKKIKACNTLPAKAKFDFIPMGTQVSFIDSSQYASKYHWDFGDGVIDTVSNPMHTYTKGGLYDVELIASNFCNSDTVTKKLAVVSLTNIYPTKGGNGGTMIATINGNGFVKETVVKLVKPGAEISGQFVQANPSGTKLTALFDLKDYEKGMWSLVATNGAQIDTLENAFEVGASTGKDIWLEVIGRETVRTGRSQNLAINFGNNGNNDVVGLPLWLVFPKGAVVEFDDHVNLNDNIVENDTIPLFFSGVLPNETDSFDIYPFIIPYLQAYNSNNLNLKYTLPRQGDFSVRAWIGEAIYNSPRSSLFDNCIIRSFTDASLDVTGVNCVFDIFELVQNTDGNNSPYAACVRQVNNCWDNPGTCDTKGCDAPGLRSMYGSAAKSVLSCTSAQGMKEIITNTSKVVLNYILTTSLNLGVCTYSFGTKVYHSLKVRSLTSFDPNAKVGPVGNTSANHLKGTYPINYTIFFENKDTAPAAAQEVVVIDTLDKRVFDLTTFQLKTIAFGDSHVIEISSGLRDYSSQVDLRPAKDLLVRVDAKMDTITGVVYWRFLSLDPTTRELTDDPLLGFLPPNIQSPHGEGRVSFSISSKRDLRYGTQIYNKAHIYFDANEPIATNAHLNTIDKVSPVSAVAGLPPIISDSVFTVKWMGSDQGSGIRSYDVYASVNDGPFRLWQYDVPGAEAKFVGRMDSSYQFYSVSRDYAGNIENTKVQGESSTQITSSITAVEKNNEDWIFKSYPNPFRQETILEFKLKAAQYVTMVVRDINAKEIAVVVDHKLYQSGVHKIIYQNPLLPAGVYICEIKSDKLLETIKLLKY